MVNFNGVPKKMLLDDMEELKKAIKELEDTILVLRFKMDNKMTELKQHKEVLEMLENALKEEKNGNA
jgi:hypothetical protein